jgi:DNA-binding IscR family transcriptional regulator
MQATEICQMTCVSPAETAKVLQLLVLGGFITSRRGSKGGFHLVRSADQITTGAVIDFFLAKHSIEPEGDCPVMCVLNKIISPGQEAFAKLSLAEIVSGGSNYSKNSPRKVAGVK